MILQPAVNVCVKNGRCRRPSRHLQCHAAGVHPSSGDDANALAPWHEALAAAAPGRAALLPRGYRGGSVAANTAALLGDTLLLAAVFEALLEASPAATPAELVAQAQLAVSNATLADAANELLPPSIGVSDAELAALPVHERGTVVEAAAAAVWRATGSLRPLRAAAALMLRTAALAEASRRGGAPVSPQQQLPAFRFREPGGSRATQRASEKAERDRLLVVRSDAVVALALAAERVDKAKKQGSSFALAAAVAAFRAAAAARDAACAELRLAELTVRERARAEAGAAEIRDASTAAAAAASRARELAAVVGSPEKVEASHDAAAAEPTRTENGLARAGTRRAAKTAVGFGK